MAYSRWSYSNWYTFWSSDFDMHYTLPTHKKKLEQVFCIDCELNLTYNELKYNFTQSFELIKSTFPSATYVEIGRAHV